MFINITMHMGNTRQDIRIDNGQTIKTAIQILRQSSKLPMGDMPEYLRSKVSNNLVSANKSFFEENIFDGDILSQI